MERLALMIYSLFFHIYVYVLVQLFIALKFTFTITGAIKSACSFRASKVLSAIHPPPPVGRWWVEMPGPFFVPSPSLYWSNKIHTHYIICIAVVADSISQHSTSMRMPTGHSQQVLWEILPLNWPSLKRRKGDTASNERKLSRHSVSKLSQQHAKLIQFYFIDSVKS